MTSPTSRTLRRLLTLDPSSTCTGYALFTSGAELIDAGRLKPAKTLSAVDRIDQIVSDVQHLIAEEMPTCIVIEITTGKSAGRLTRKVQGLGVYGMAVGAIRQACRDAMGKENVTSIEENVWTNSIPKRKRLQLLRIALPEYRAGKDPGGDAGDAIDLGLWWLGQNEE